jgi:hypothetical protein
MLVPQANRPRYTEGRRRSQERKNLKPPGRGGLWVARLIFRVTAALPATAPHRSAWQKPPHLPAWQSRTPRSRRSSPYRPPSAFYPTREAHWRQSHVASQRRPSRACSSDCRPESEPLSQRLQAQIKEMVANTHNPTPAAGHSDRNQGPDQRDPGK